MTDPSTEALIATLTRELQPVGRLRAPAVRALLWLGLVGALGFVMAIFADNAALARRMAIAPDMWLSVLGAILTMITACIAAFQLSLPTEAATGRGCLCRLPYGGSVRVAPVACALWQPVRTAPLAILWTVLCSSFWSPRPCRSF